MATTPLLAITAFAVATLAVQNPPTPDDWVAAERAIVRLEPSAFPMLPPEVVAALAPRGCRIPQTVFASHPENVISGHFFDDPRPLDWAVLCSRNGRSAIVVVPGEAGDHLLAPGGREIVEIHELPDATFLQVVSPGRIGFSRSLSVASAERIATARARYGSPALPPLMHDGVEDAFAEKASIIWYRYAGRWLHLQGAD